MKYVFVFHLPGAAGNFITRCLNLLDNSYCWMDPKSNYIPSTTEEKLKLLAYQPGKQDEWVRWEFQLATLYNPNQPVAMPNNAEIVAWKFHPEYKFLLDPKVEPGDQVVPVYIDAHDYFEWCILNSLYKTSFLKREWFEQGEQMRRDPAIFNISLRAVAQNENTFIAEFERLCRHLDRQLLEHERIAVLDLYRQWVTTTLQPDQFDSFKQQIGFHL